MHVKRIASTVGLTLGAMLLAAGQAGAVVNDPAQFVAPPGATKTIAIEKISPTTGFIDDFLQSFATTTGVGAAANAIQWQLGGGATFNAPTSVNLCNAAAVGVRGVGDAIVVGATRTIANGGNTIIFTLGAVLPSVNVYIAKTCGVNPGPGELDIAIPSALAAGSVVPMTVSFSAAGETPPSATNNAYAVFQQFTATTPGVAVVTIDVNKDLKKFIGPVPAELQAVSAAAGFTFVNNAGGITSVNFATANIALTVTGSMVGISKVELVATGTTTPSLLTFAIGTGQATANLLLPTGIAGAFQVLITIDGTTVLDDRNFNLSATLAPAGDIVQGSTQINPLSAALVGAVQPGNAFCVLGTNGTQFITPFLRQDSVAGVTSVFRLENVTGVARNYWSLIDNNGTWSILNAKVPLGLGPDNAAVILGSDIVADAAALGITLPSGGFAFRVVVDEAAAPQNVSAFASQQQVGSGFRNAPMLKKPPTAVNPGAVWTQ